MAKKQFLGKIRITSETEKQGGLRRPTSSLESSLKPENESENKQAEEKGFITTSHRLHDMIVGFLGWAILGNILFLFLVIAFIPLFEQFGISGIYLVVISYLSTIVSMVVLLVKGLKWVSIGIVIAVLVNISLWLAIFPTQSVIMFATCPLPIGYFMVMN